MVVAMTDYFSSDPFAPKATTEDAFSAATPASSEPEPEPEVVEQVEEKVEPAKRKPARRGASRRTTTKPIDAILKGIKLSREVAGYTDDDLATIAEILGTEAEPDIIAASIASGAKGDTAIIEAVVGLAEVTDQFEAGIKAHQLTEDRKVFPKVWALVARHANLPAEQPRASTDAAMALARAVDGLSTSDIEAIRRPLELLGR